MAWNDSVTRLATTSRRKVLASALIYATSLTVRSSSATGKEKDSSTFPAQRTDPMTSITTKDGVQIFYKDWGPKTAQPIVFHHGWPLSSDDWEAQMLFFVGKGYRVVAHDRRGHGRSSQVSDGQDMDHYAADAATVVEHLDLRNTIHISHSTGGGAANRAQFYLDFASGPFYGYNRPGAKVSQGVIQNWWRQAMMGGAKAQYDST